MSDKKKSRLLMEVEVFFGAVDLKKIERSSGKALISCLGALAGGDGAEEIIGSRSPNELAGTGATLGVSGTSNPTVGRESSGLLLGAKPGATVKLVAGTL
eukprot:TRINITY_DN4198_c0_g4_i1.p2 TRINITY_DN4198_c0_g4~~TRINITY_DN4198_c0_g4_i1.p2  ORF type:complete len:100 (+),score=5.46 TRINITY_DN4198_c0_g4_i1:145-444(+)